MVAVGWCKPSKEKRSTGSGNTNNDNSLTVDQSRRFETKAEHELEFVIRDSVDCNESAEKLELVGLSDIDRWRFSNLLQVA